LSAQGNVVTSSRSYIDFGGSASVVLVTRRVRVLFDHQIFSYQRFGGASRYFHELISELDGTIDVELGVARTPNEYLRGARYYRGQFTERTGTAAFLATYARNELATRIAARRPHDVFHATFYDPAVLRVARGAKLVVTVLDMIPERFPELFALPGLYNRLVTRRWIDGKRRLCERADAILAISEHTKRDVVAFYGIDPARITVTHLATRLAGGGSRPAGLPERYVLYVGTRNTYKNFDLVLRGLARLDVGLACIGGSAFTAEERARIAELGLAERVVQRDVADRELAACYAHALAFVFPSRYEGFGIPILEAFACDCPVVAANASCFPEIAGDAARYFDPDDAAGLASALAEVIADPAPWRARGRDRVRGFSWAETARRTIEAYKAA
jgi:glycosyltransferase involved in cell wall biosynthesis